MAALARFIATGLLLLSSVAQGADEMAVDVVNASTPTLCAEEDNVYLKLQSDTVRRFRIEAQHPAYIGLIAADRTAPDFRHCNSSADPSFSFQPRRLTLFENAEWQLVGFTFPSFWRPGRVPVQVGDRVESGFHLLQLWTRTADRHEEVLVLYPADGYWRARPLSPQHLRATAYGSSFLVGPIEADGRPFVDIGAVRFDPTARTFTLNFVRGGSATVHLDAVDQERIVLDVGFDARVATRPFAALRSMFVTETNNDVAQVGWRDNRGWTQEAVMKFSQARSAEIWAGRVSPSRHNTSSPDMLFGGFSADR